MSCCFLSDCLDFGTIVFFWTIRIHQVHCFLFWFRRNWVWLTHYIVTWWCWIVESSHCRSMLLVIQLNLELFTYSKSNLFCIKSSYSIMLFNLILCNKFLEALLQSFGFSFTMNNKFWGIINYNSNKHLHYDKHMLNRKNENCKLHFIPIREWTDSKLWICLVNNTTIRIGFYFAVFHLCDTHKQSNHGSTGEKQGTHVGDYAKFY